MSYKRVIPRDFYNEAKLLKCMGQLSLKTHDEMLPNGLSITIKESGQPFDIDMYFGYDALYVANYDTEVNGESVVFMASYNSKDNYPLYCLHLYRDGDLIQVFTDKGEFHPDFIEAFAAK